MLKTLKSLNAMGLLGINRRNTSYTLKWNDRRFYPLVDDKLQTKRLCEKAGIPTARLLTVAERIGDLASLFDELAGHDDFVLKPARGAMGNGILVIKARDGLKLQKAGGAWIDQEAFIFHASGIISGLYALGGRPDVALVEERLIVHPELAAICSDGVPDYRVIVFRGVPVMAMVRLPTSVSAGRANLHQGAVGIGVNLATCRSSHAVIRSRPTTHHPDTGEPVVDRLIPGFARAVDIAVQATDLVHLGYVGADIVVDATRGPVVLELNARPGLAIQIANRCGLLPRLNEVDRRWRPGMSLEDRLALGREIAGRLAPDA
jgi:alpha-L-glutamate ligase-like protein